MTSAGGGGGINLTTLWVNIAPSMSGMTKDMIAGGQKAGKEFSAAFEEGWATGLSKIMSTIQGAFAKLWSGIQTGLTTAVEAASYAIQHIMEGKAPDVSDLTAGFQQLEGMIGTVGEKMVGWVPIIGDVASQFVGQWTQAFQTVTGLAGTWMGTLQEMGNQWQEIGRQIEGATGASADQLEHYLEITQRILASGDIVHIEDVAAAIGVVGDRIHGLNDEQLAEFTTTVAQAEELLGKFNVGQAVSALNQWGIEGEAAQGKFAGLVHIAQDAKMPFDTLTAQLQQMGPILQDFGVSLDSTAEFLGRFAKEGFRPERLAYTFGRAANDIVQKGGDLKGSLEGIFTVAQNLSKAGDQTGAFAYIESIFGPYGGPRTLAAIQNMHVAMDQLFTGMHDGMNEDAGDIKRQVESTANLSDQVMGIRNRMMGDLRSVSEEFSKQLTEAGRGLSQWFEEHHTQVLEFTKEVTDAILNDTSQILKLAADGVGVIAPFLNVAKSALVEFSKAVLGVMELMGNLGSHLPGSLGQAGRDLHDGAIHAEAGLNALNSIDFTRLATNTKDAIDGVANTTLPNLRDQLNAALQPTIDFSKQMDVLGNQMQAMPEQKTFKISGNTAALEDGLKKVGITFEHGQDNVVTKVHATNKQVAEEFETWYKEHTNEKLDVNLVVVPTDKNGNPIEAATDALKPSPPVVAGVPAPGAPGAPAPGAVPGATTSSTQRPTGGTTPAMVPTEALPPAALPPNAAPYTGGSPPAAPGAIQADWDAIAQKESGGRWNEVLSTGVTEGGGLQIKPGTWADFGGLEFAEKPYLATKENQIKVAERILNGWNGKPGQGPAAWANGSTFVYKGGAPQTPTDVTSGAPASSSTTPPPGPRVAAPPTPSVTPYAPEPTAAIPPAPHHAGAAPGVAPPAGPAAPATPAAPAAPPRPKGTPDDPIHTSMSPQDKEDLKPRPPPPPSEHQAAAHAAAAALAPRRGGPQFAGTDAMVAAGLTPKHRGWWAGSGSVTPEAIAATHELVAPGHEGETLTDTLVPLTSDATPRADTWRLTPGVRPENRTSRPTLPITPPEHSNWLTAVGSWLNKNVATPDPTFQLHQDAAKPPTPSLGNWEGAEFPWWLKGHLSGGPIGFQGGGHVPWWEVGGYNDPIENDPYAVHTGDEYLGEFQGGGDVFGSSYSDPSGAADARANRYAASIAGTPYQLGVGPFDCSGLVANTVEQYTGTRGRIMPGNDPAHPMSTGTEGEWLTSMGLSLGVGGPGTLRVGWETVTDAGGHTAMTLPDGTNLEAAGSKGVVTGKAARGADDPLFTIHAFLPFRPVALGSMSPRILGGLLSMQGGGFMDGHVPYLGPIGRDSVHAVLEPGEFVVKRDVAMKNLNSLHLLNQGVKGFQDGGMAAAESWVQSLNGQPYNANGWIDCSGLASGIVSILKGEQPHRLFNTTDFGSDEKAAAQGFSPGYQPGALNVAVNPNPGDSGHMIAQFPDGTVVESSGTNGIQYGSNTAMSAGEFSRWYHFGGQNQAPNQTGPSDASFPTSSGDSSASPGGGGGGGGGGFTMAGITQATQGYVTDPVSGQQTFLGPGAYYKYIYDQRKNEADIARQQGDLTALQSTITEDTGKANQAYSDWQTAKANLDKAVSFVQHGAGAPDWQPGQPLPAGIPESLLSDKQPGGKSYNDLFTAYTNANDKLRAATDRVTTETRTAGEKQTAIDEARAKPPERPKQETITPEKHAEQLGKGLISGLLQGLGFDSSVFSNPLDWGLYKMFTGVVGYGMGKVNQIQQQGGTPSGPAAPQASETGSGLLGFLNSFLPGVDKVLQPTANNIPAAMSPPRGPEPGPEPAPGGDINFNLNGIMSPDNIGPIANNFMVDNSRAPALQTPTIPSG